MWNTLRQLVSSNKNKTCPLLLEDDIIISVEVNRFHRCFTNVGKEFFEKSHQYLSNHDNELELNACDTINLTCDMFRPQPTDSQTIIPTMKQLENSFAHGFDGILTHFFKEESLPVIMMYLTRLINT